MPIASAPHTVYRSPKGGPSPVTGAVSGRVHDDKRKEAYLKEGKKTSVLGLKVSLTPGYVGDRPP